MKILTILLLLALFSIGACEKYKKKCLSYVEPKVEALALDLSERCKCNYAETRKQLKVIPDQICLRAYDNYKSDGMIGTPASILCVVAKDLIIEQISFNISKKLKCEIPIHDCLSFDKLEKLIDNYVCSSL